MRKWIILIIALLLCCTVFTNGQIRSEDYHSNRTHLNNSHYSFTKNKKGRVAFLGGSITYNPGWRDSICTYLEKSFPKTDFEFIAAGIPSMGSTPGAFRLERDILSKGSIDLLFVEAAVNDATNGRTATEQVRGMEGIIRHTRSDNPKTDIVLMYFVDPDKMADYNSGHIPEVIQSHEQVAKHYKISSINLAREVTDRINAGEFSWEDDFKDLHPSPFGQQIYFKSMRAFLDNQLHFNKRKSTKYPLTEKLDPFCYDRGTLVSIEKTTVKSGWQIDPRWEPGNGVGTREGYVDIPMLCAGTPGSELQLKFRGKAIGLAVAAGPDAGMIEYSIDGAGYEPLDLFTQWSPHLHLPWYYVLEAEFSNKRHEIFIRISQDKNPESLGNACRIKHFFINE